LQPLFDGYEPAKKFVRDLAPDVTVVVYNDLGLEVSLDRVPTFGIGAADFYKVGDWGGGHGRFLASAVIPYSVGI